MNICYLFPKIKFFLEAGAHVSMGRQISMVTFEEIVEISKLGLTNKKMPDDDFTAIQHIIEMIYDYTVLTFHQSSTSKLNNLFLECLGIMYNKGIGVTEAIYAELLVKSPDNFTNFYEFFEEYFKRDQD